MAAGFMNYIVTKNSIVLWEVGCVTHCHGMFSERCRDRGSHALCLREDEGKSVGDATHGDRAVTTGDSSQY